MQVKELDALPFPAWDLIDFDTYAKRPKFAKNIRGKRYAPIFTSRGCPYKCAYCHNVFGKKFRWRSAENVLKEVHLLKDTFGVDELEIVDDIFNLHRPRLKKICKGLQPLNMHICFPNGLRADILKKETVKDLADAGTYEVNVAVETVTPRLQTLVEKYVNFRKLTDAVKWMNQYGIAVKGFFMIGFPTETKQEIENTIQYALQSDFTYAGFFSVVPQRGTRIYDLAMSENSEALKKISMDDYYSDTTWYSEAYRIDLKKIQKKAFLKFYLTNPKRILRILKFTRFKALLFGIYDLIKITFYESRGDVDIEPELPGLQSSAETKPKL